MNAHVS